MTDRLAFLQPYLAERRELVDGALHRLFPAGDPAKLHEACCWALFGGGKRLRPVLVLAAAELFGADPQDALPAACAVEMIHTYSLIHDDLPCMDDDSMRRGRPTTHVQFGEALALLAGDALLTQAFATVGEAAGYAGDVPAEVRLELATSLSAAAGWRGMVGGQSIDLGFEGDVTDEARLTHLHRLKTGQLFRWSLRAGALIGGASATEVKRLGNYGYVLGLAFQIADDVLDELQDQTERGDDASETPSFTGLMGIEGSRSKARELFAQAEDLLAGFDERADPLRHLAWYAVHRDV